MCSLPPPLCHFWVLAPGTGLLPATCCRRSQKKATHARVLIKAQPAPRAAKRNFGGSFSPRAPPPIPPPNPMPGTAHLEAEKKPFFSREIPWLFPPSGDVAVRVTTEGAELGTCGMKGCAGPRSTMGVPKSWGGCPQTLCIRCSLAGRSPALRVLN